jgi:hypothetical protein
MNEACPVVCRPPAQLTRISDTASIRDISGCPQDCAAPGGCRGSAGIETS